MIHFGMVGKKGLNAPQRFVDIDIQFVKYPLKIVFKYHNVLSGMVLNGVLRNHLVGVRYVDIGGLHPWLVACFEGRVVHHIELLADAALLHLLEDQAWHCLF